MPTSRCYKLATTSSLLQARRGRREKLASPRWSHDGHNQLPKIILGVKCSPTESELSDRKLKPLPPDPFRLQDSATALFPRRPGPTSRMRKIPWGNDGKPGLVRLDRRHWHCMEETNAPPYERID